LAVDPAEGDASKRIEVPIFLLAASRLGGLDDVRPETYGGALLKVFHALDCKFCTVEEFVAGLLRAGDSRQ
jgi:hypothetical protein